MEALRADDYTVLTFDCYGTLVDWETGMLECLQPILLQHDAHVIDSFLLEFFADNEPELQAAGGSYAEVLRNIVQRLGTRVGFTPTESELDALASSIRDWQPFADTVEALARLAARFDLVIISNTDNALFEATQQKLGVELKQVVTAEDVGAYKPSPKMFQAAVAAVAVAPSQILHVAQSLFHDIGPASEMGMDTVWIDRNAGTEGAARVSDAKPSWTFPSLESFTDKILE